MQKAKKKTEQTKATRVAATLPTFRAQALNNRLLRYGFLVIVAAGKFENFFRQRQKLLKVGAKTEKSAKKHICEFCAQRGAVSNSGRKSE